VVPRASLDLAGHMWRNSAPNNSLHTLHCPYSDLETTVHVIPFFFFNMYGKVLLSLVNYYRLLISSS
jgi:hypothetical protein